MNIYVCYGPPEDGPLVRRHNVHHRPLVRAVGRVQPHPRTYSKSAREGKVEGYHCCGAVGGDSAARMTTMPEEIAENSTTPLGWTPQRVE